MAEVRKVVEPLHNYQITSSLCYLKWQMGLWGSDFRDLLSKLYELVLSLLDLLKKQSSYYNWLFKHVDIYVFYQR